MANENLNLAPLLDKLGQNPAAVSMLQSLIGGLGGGQSSPENLPHGDTEAAESEHRGDDPREGESVPAISFSPPPAPPGYGHGKGRREVLLSLRGTHTLFVISHDEQLQAAADHLLTFDAITMKGGTAV